MNLVNDKLSKVAHKHSERRPLWGILLQSPSQSIIMVCCAGEQGNKPRVIIDMLAVSDFMDSQQISRAEHTFYKYINRFKTMSAFKCCFSFQKFIPQWKAIALVELIRRNSLFLKGKWIRLSNQQLKQIGICKILEDTFWIFCNSYIHRHF